MKFVAPYAGFVALAVLGTVAFSQELAPLPTLSPTVVTKQAASPSHELAPNDTVEIKVFQEADLDTIARVSGDGKISFPLIGEVVVGGKTAQQAAKLIRDRLEARFLVNPQVSLTVTETARRLFTVLGQVQRPGTYRFPDGQALNLIQVIGIAGGYTRLADTGRITIKRQVNGVETVLRVDGGNMARKEGTTAFDIQSGDMITIAERLF
jgi:polysaccharide export outer membrane protein